MMDLWRYPPSNMKFRHGFVKEIDIYLNLNFQKLKNHEDSCFVMQNVTLGRKRKLESNALHTGDFMWHFTS